jgi:predicted alpha/beta-hydrolase family hydrolase
MVFTHGAGGGLSAAAVVNFCAGYSPQCPVLAFKGSMNMGSRVKGFHACFDHLQEQGEPTTGMPVVFGGRSMGARAAVVGASEILESPAKKNYGLVTLVLVSYPLVGPKDMRDQILLDLPPNVRVLFIIGEKDSMCPLDKLNEVREKMGAKTWLVVVKGADHGMHVRPAKAEKAVGEMTGQLAAKWVSTQTLAVSGDEKEVQIWWDADDEGVKSGVWEGVTS